MLGVGMALTDTQAMQALAGRVVLFAVPAEEFVELEYRARLRAAGEIESLSGKPELIRLGAFDDVDVAMMVHSTANTPGRRIRVGGSTSGFLAKTVRFAGRPSHAGGRPDLGVNALNAAALAIMGINAQRETFRDEDAIRVHHILTRGGEVVNVVPDDVRMEPFVRGRTLAAIVDTATEVDRALRRRCSWTTPSPSWAPTAWSRRGTARRPPTWATSRTSCPRCTRSRGASTA